MNDSACQFPRLILLLGLVSAFASPVRTEGAEPTDFNQAQYAQAFGRAMGAEFKAGAPGGKVKTAAWVTVLGVVIPALVAIAQPPNTIDGTTYTEFYSFNRRVFSQSAYYTHTGISSIRAGLTPAEVRVPAVVYPVGPLVLQIDGGTRFQADLEAELQPTIVVPAQWSQLGVNLQAHAMGAGFVEGYAKLLAVRGGVGGQIDLIDGKASVRGQFHFDGETHPKVSSSGIVEFLKGRFYAFVDAFNVFRWGWKRLWKRNLYQWNGYCYSTENQICPSN